MKPSFKNSDSYRKKIHGLIPGGAHTYSKGDDQFPELSPAAITHGKGIHVWDLDGNRFTDCLMGLTAVSLGHAYEPVLKKVREELDKGVNFSRPSVVEAELAEKFISLIPSHQRVKFAKNGSAVTTAAVKLARAYTGRDKVAFPGNHPFYSYDDWFIGKTACHKGVPDATIGLSLTFEADNLDSLRKLFSEHPDEIACIITEPEKLQIPDPDFLKQAIEVTHAHGAIFILDEMITGFKTGFPGSMTKYGIQPDLATWGKGIANGFSLCALTGKKEIMDLGGILEEGKEKVFLVSTTHGGETHSMRACLATIEEFENKHVQQYNMEIGNKILTGIWAVIEEKRMNQYLSVGPMNWLPSFQFNNAEGKPDMGFRTLFMQEMIQKGFLFQGIFSPSFSCTNEDAEGFISAFRETIPVYQKALEAGFGKFLTGKPIKPVFRKHN